MLALRRKLSTRSEVFGQVVTFAVGLQGFQMGRRATEPVFG